MVDERREVRVGGVKGRATTWDHAGEVSPVGHRHVAVQLAVPEGDWKVQCLEIEPPGPSEECQVPHRATRSATTSFLEAGHEAVTDLGLLEQGPIGLGNMRAIRSLAPPPPRIARKLSRKSPRASGGAARASRTIARSGPLIAALMPGASSGAMPPSTPTLRTRPRRAAPHASA